MMVRLMNASGSTYVTPSSRLIASFLYLSSLFPPLFFSFLCGPCLSTPERHRNPLYVYPPLYSSSCPHPSSCLSSAQMIICDVWHRCAVRYVLHLHLAPPSPPPPSLPPSLVLGDCKSAIPAASASLLCVFRPFAHQWRSPRACTNQINKFPFSATPSSQLSFLYLPLLLSSPLLSLYFIKLFFGHSRVQGSLLIWAGVVLTPSPSLYPPSPHPHSCPLHPFTLEESQKSERRASANPSYIYHLIIPSLPSPLSPRYLSPRYLSPLPSIPLPSPLSLPSLPLPLSLSIF